MRRLSGLLVVAAATAACDRGPRAETVFAYPSATWFEDGWSYFQVAPGGGATLFGARFGFRLFTLPAGRENESGYRGTLDRVQAATFDHAGNLARLGSRELEAGWFVEASEGVVLSPIPAFAIPHWSPDGALVAYYRPGTNGVAVGEPEDPTFVELGAPVTGIGWTPAGDTVYALVFHDDGASSLVRITVPTGTAETVQRQLDAPARFNTIAARPGGRTVYLALAGAEPPDPEARHRPDADRDTDIFALDVASGALRAVAAEPGDDFYPQIVGDHLYWTHNEYRDQIAVLPAGGGEARAILDDAQIPYWSHDGAAIGYTFGGWRIADWGLNLDAGMVRVNDSAQAVSAPEPIIVGYHEDFTPAWSPDGRWLAYHSHRSDGPIPAYGAPGTTDDLYLKRAGEPGAEEIRLTDFGWEVGMADWSPDGRRLVFDSWERGGTAGVAHPWIATIDPASGKLVRAERIPLPPELTGTLLAAWSPTRDEIVLVQRIEGTRQALWLIAPDGADARRIHEFESTTYGGVDWTPDGDTLVFGGLAGGRMQLFALARQGGAARQLTNDAANLFHPQVSPNGRWIAATRASHVKQLRRLPLRSN